ncbi:choice-of-anchor C family protein [Pseudomonadota bacterium]
MRTRLLGAVCGCIFSLLGISTSAHAVFLNGSFENGGVFVIPLDEILVLGSSGSSATRINWWNVTQDSIDWVGTEFWQASDGNFSLDLSGSQAGAIAQTFDTVIGQQYRVLFDKAANPDENGSTIKTFQVSAAGTVSTYTTDRTGHTLQNMGWEQDSFLFSATDSLTTLTFTSLTPGVYGAALDNVQVNAVPLPPALWLFGSGLLGLIGLAKRRVQS